MAGKKILIVDDDPDIVEAMRVVLENNDYDVQSASDSKSGLQQVSEQKPDLLILDVMMDGMQDGVDLAREIRQKPDLQRIPILMVTAVKDHTGINLKTAAGDEDWLPVDEVLDKPVKPDVLLKKVTKLIR